MTGAGGVRRNPAGARLTRVPDPAAEVIALYDADGRRIGGRAAR
ncbi:hypothetical protein TOK_5077 [Pseudonocardia sp. N23]|nr:hypothetical protein TOK_5077 [Pseudonocardia sp. N23]